MLRLIPPPLARSGFRLAHALRKQWWRMARPDLLGCRVLAFDAQGAVLLIRHSYGSGCWMLPGGGVARGEDPVAAAIRELREEAGCLLHAAVAVALVDEELHGARNRVHVIAGHVRDAVRADGREVVEAAFFAADLLPDDVPAMLRAGLPGWITAAKAGGLRDAAALPSAPRQEPKG